MWACIAGLMRGQKVEDSKWWCEAEQMMEGDPVAEADREKPTKFKASQRNFITYLLRLCSPITFLVYPIS